MESIELLNNIGKSQKFIFKYGKIRAEITDPESLRQITMLIEGEERELDRLTNAYMKLHTVQG